MSQNLDLVGILDGQRAFIGPELVQIDLTNSCNNDCIGCWCRSPLLGDRIIPIDIEKQTLPLGLVKKVLDDCAAMGTTNIYIAGGGEPFMHPDIMEIISHIKELGLACHINTNLTLANKDFASKLVNIEIDNLIVSLWAATPETYSRTHPNKSEATFEQLIDTLRHIIRLRQGAAPHITLYNVIMNFNYKEIEAMVKLALELGVNAVEFTVVDVIPGHTDRLLFNSQEQAAVMEACERIRNLMNRDGFIDKLEVRIEDFFKRISIPEAVNGDYDTEMLNETPCLIGWNFTRILADGNVNACLKAHRIPIGNIYNTPFPEIWNSPEQMHFRRKTLEGNKNDPFFSLIGNDESTKVGCLRGCDDIERNRRLWKRMQQQTIFHKIMLRGIGCFLRTKAIWENRN